MGQTLSGYCLCKAVRLTLTIDKRDIESCHCEMCVRWGGGPLFVVHGTDLAFDDEANVTCYRSSAWAERGFCRQCGTHLFYRLLDADFQAVPASILDDGNGWKLEQQIYIDAKPGYYTLRNETRCLTGAEVEAKFSSGTGKFSD